MLCAIILMTMLLVSGFPQPARADIYMWTDENGVKHITNSEPPPQAEVLLKSREVPYDEAKDRERMEADRLQAQQQQLLELQEKQAILADAQQMAANRLAEANRRAEDMLQQAEELLQEARQTSEDDINWYGGYFYYGPWLGHYYRGPYPYHRKPRPDWKYDRHPTSSHRTGWNNRLNFSSRHDLGRADRGSWQGRTGRPGRASVNRSSGGNDSTGGDFSDYSQGRGRFGRSGLTGLRR